MKLIGTAAAVALMVSAGMAPALAGNGKISSDRDNSAGKERAFKISRALMTPKFANPEGEKPTPKITPLFSHDPPDKDSEGIVDVVGYPIKKPKKNRP